MNNGNVAYPTASTFLGSKAPLAMTLFFIAFMTFIFFMTFMAFIASRHDGASPIFVDQMSANMGHRMV